MHRGLHSVVLCLLWLPGLALAQPAPPPSRAEPAPLASEPHPGPTATGSLPPAVPEGRPGRHSLEVAYLGHNFVHPGLQVGYSFRALQSPTRRHALVLGVDAGGYAWLRHDFGVFVLPRVGWRGRHRSGLQGEVNFHLGYLQSLLSSPAYAVEAGQVVEASRAGIANLLFGATAGIGWLFPRAGLTPFARLGAVWHTPVFDQLLMRFVLNLGVEIRR